MTELERMHAAWLHAYEGRHDATVDCHLLRGRLTRALDALDAAVDVLNAVRAEHRVRAIAVDPAGEVTRYCDCGTRDCRTQALLGGDDA